MDQLLVVTIRLLALLGGLVSALSIRLGERLKAKLLKSSSTYCRRTSRGASGHRTIGGVPAVQPGAVRQTCPTGSATRSIAAAPEPEPAPTQQDSEAPPALEPDELDWAGSLNHAAVASLHLRQFLTLVRSGWLIADEARLAEVGAALDATEAFQARTEAAIAPLINAMSEAQRAEFFEDFWDELPVDHPELED